MTFARNNRWTARWISLCFALWGSTASPLLAGESSVGGGGQPVEQPLHHFTLLTEPQNAKVEIVNLKSPYQPNMLLKPGRYHIIVSASGHETEKGFVDVVDQDWIGKVVLRPLNEAVMEEEPEERSNARLQEEWRKIKQEHTSLEQARRVIAQEQHKLDLTRKELDAARQSVELAKKEWVGKQASCPSPTESRSVADDKPVVENKPVVDGKPAMESGPAAEARPAVESKPAAEARPAVESKPAAEAKPVVESKPVAEVRPAVESKPAAEVRSAAESKPAAEVRPAAESKPVAEVRPVVESKPAADSRPAVDSPPAPDAKPLANDKVPAESRALLDSKPVDDSKSVAESKPLVGSKPTPDGKSVALALTDVEPLVKEKPPAPAVRSELPTPVPPPHVNTRERVRKALVQEETTPPPPVQEIGESPPRAGEPETAEGAAAPATTPAPPSATVATDQGPLSAVLTAAMAYLQQARPPQSAPPPEGEGVLRALRQAQQQEPGNPSVDTALKLYEKRYIIYTGLFENKVKADEMVENIRALGIPAFLQPMTVKGRSTSRVCIGLFLTQEDADKNLRHLKENMEIKDPILRIYRQ
ncbi:MAG: SPOR domain-containing protein [Magnetococcus sp. MYC-9]